MTQLNEMSMSRAEAIEKCSSLGKKFIEHFDKIYKDRNCETVHPWECEMQAWFDSVKSIKLKINNRPILFGSLRDWFFTACANPEDYLEDADEDELYYYDRFCNYLAFEENTIRDALMKSEVLDDLTHLESKINLV